MGKNILHPVSASFKVHQSLREELEKWLEEEHYPEMIATGHFEPRRYKIPAGAPDQNGFQTLLYIHEAKSTSDWNQYEANHRQGLKDKFGARWGDALKDGRLVVVGSAGVMEVNEYAEAERA